ncbi:MULTISPECIES: serine/threonine-protein kinase [unclassified Nocardioides]|uniref:serine/threonine-protein kinase n=1 Tax=unclassified Nocardioides TaxID=2615069 RepID=UPI000AF71D38|nr:MULTISPECIES: serine/threonine-protein kinase [unclassified Nocardioides]
MSTLIAGRYQLDREIGRGGMGAVWLARDVVLGRDVALKRVGLLPGTDSADVERVRREARVSAMLNHAHVVAVYDLVTEGHDHWLVMEHVPSRDLGEIIRQRGPLSPDETAHLIGQAAKALAAAHRAGIVHRDIKPGNMLVTDDGRLKLGDFGIARTKNDPTLTQTGMVTGSPAYLSPEVASGSSASPASDMWSLGATVFHAVTGSPPYDASENLIGALYRLVHDEPPRTDRAGWLAPLLLATMHTDPAGRWNAQQVAQFLSAGPSASAPPIPVAAPARPSPASPQTAVIPAAPAPANQHAAPPPSALPPTPHRRKRSWGAIVAVVAIVLALAGVGGWLATRDNDSPSGNASDGSTSTDTGSESPADEPTADGMSQFITTYLDTVTSDPASSWEMLTPRFQDASNGFGSYTGFWGTVAKASVSDIVADPDSLVISYHVDYTMKAGKNRSDDVQLQLAYQDGTYLIDDEF